jgi:phosphate/sulfate permease
LLVVALLVACGFEFINGFHDTANAVATVIYTRSLRPGTAVILSGICNFLGVVLGGTAVAMGIVKLLPVELLVTHQFGTSMAMVFALLSGAILWNFGTWFLGLPASSSHTLIGAILGIGLANAYVSGAPLASGVNWGKATEIGMALLLSPIIGFSASAVLFFLSRKLASHPEFQRAPKDGENPPWIVRALLIGTSGGVSLTHGSNDGQKGIGLIMLVLIAVLPGQFAIRSTVSPQEIQQVAAGSHHLVAFLSRDQVQTAQAAPQRALGKLLPVAQAEVPVSPKLVLASAQASAIERKLEGKTQYSDFSDEDRFELRTQILKLDQSLGQLERSNASITHTADWASVQKARKQFKALTEYSPTWVIVMVALSIGLGTMIGWRRVVVTVGERIGKSQLTYAQGASAQLVAMSTIGLSAWAGLPVSTTHVLSSGVAGTMVAGRAGLQSKTVKHIIWAWLLTLPVSMLLSASLYLLFLQFVQR